MMRRITVDNTSSKDFHQFMLGSVTPRPIALVSTLSEDGGRNLAPYSYFNAVSSIPPILMVSIGRKQDGTKKDTLTNIEENGEFVVNMVPFKMIRQMALTSVQLPSEEDEFDLAGLHSVESSSVRPYRVEESPIHFECKLNRIVELGAGKGICNLVFGDVQCMHVDESIIDEKNRIDPTKLEIVGRLGRSYYSKTGSFSLETVVMPQLKIPIGYEALPEGIINSDILSSNEVARLASMYELPEKKEIEIACRQYQAANINFNNHDLHNVIKSLIQEENLNLALKLALGLS